METFSASIEPPLRCTALSRKPMPEQSPIRILVCAGETSGDMYGAAILRELRAIAQRPLDCYGIGGDQMKAEGVELFAHASVTGVMGF